MSSEYEPLFGTSRAGDDEALEEVRERFREAARPYLSSPWSWCVWAVLLPAAALATPALTESFGPAGAVFTWSAAILVGGAVEALSIRRAGGGGSGLASWAMRTQGNLSLVALALSGALLLAGEARFLPGLWLLLLGHSFVSLGGLSHRIFKRYGFAYQLGGLVAVGLPEHALPVFAVTTALANLGLGVALLRGAASDQ